MATHTPREIVDQYFAAMAKKDFDAIRPLLRDDVTFVGSLGKTDGIDDYIKGLQGTLATMTTVERRVVITHGDEVAQVYDLTMSKPAVTLPIAQWLTIRDGKIAALRVFFDPRPLMQG